MQMIQLEMLAEVDRICRKCNIHYNIIAGTLLGAVRHGGYIPWDDDADVAFLRPEYEKFRIACETELDGERFYFQDHRNTKGYRWGYGKLRRKGTLFVREHQEHMPYEQNRKHYGDLHIDDHAWQDDIFFQGVGKKLEADHQGRF